MLALLTVFFIHASGTPELKEVNKREAIQIRNVQFIGNHQVSEAQLQRVIRPYLNRSISESELDEIAEQIQILYRSKGLTGVKLPIERTGSSLTIHVIEK